MSSLRGRLLLSYLVVIGICLILVILTLVVVARPVQERLLRARLAAQVGVLAPRLRLGLRQQSLSLDELSAALEARPATDDLHWLIVDQNSQVLVDSAGNWVGQATPFPFDPKAAGSRASNVSPGTGGTSWIYAAVALGQADTGSHLWLVGIVPRPRSTLRLLGELGQGLLLAGGLTFVLSVLLALVIARSVARPMHKMSEVAKTIAAGSYDQAQAIDVRGPDEVQVLAKSLQAMATQVQASQQAMRDLVVNVSHDLKTPLTSVQGFAQALLEDVTQDEVARRRAATVIYEEASRMARMVDELGDLARIDSGQMQLTREPVDVAAVVLGVIEALRPLAEEKGISVLHSGADRPIVLGDADRIRQVITNLLDNALKYSVDGGQVQIETRMIGAAGGRAARAKSWVGWRKPETSESGEQKWVLINVTDNGPGIPAEELPRIFERFYRVDKSRTSGRGRGLGLAIAKEIVYASGGELGVESVEGLGTRFTVRLPAKDDVLSKDAPTMK